MSISIQIHVCDHTFSIYLLLYILFPSLLKNFLLPFSGYVHTIARYFSSPSLQLSTYFCNNYCLCACEPLIQETGNGLRNTIQSGQQARYIKVTLRVDYQLLFCPLFLFSPFHCFPLPLSIPCTFLQ